MTSLEGTPFRARALLEPTRVVRAMLVASALTLAVASYGRSLPLSLCLLVASREVRLHPSSRRATWWALGGVTPYVVVAVGEGLLLSTHALGDTWSLIQLAHGITVLAGFPGGALAIACAVASWRSSSAHRAPSLDATPHVLLATGAGLVAGGTVASFLHLTFRAMPATLLVVAMGVGLLAMLVKQEVQRVLWLRRVYAEEEPSWSVVASEDDASLKLPLLARALLDRDAVAVLQREAAPGGYRATEGPVRVARCPLDVKAAADPSWRRIVWAALLMLLVAAVGAVTMAVPELLKFLR